MMMMIITFLSITVDTFAENDLRTFPLITFCPLMKDVIQLVDEETTFQQVLDQSPTRDLIILPKADEPMLVGKWTKTFKFFSHPKYGSRRLVQACFTYDHGKNVKVGSYEDHVSISKRSSISKHLSLKSIKFSLLSTLVSTKNIPCFLRFFVVDRRFRLCIEFEALLKNLSR